MNKKSIYIILIALLAILSTVLIFNKSNSSIKKDLRDFAVKDTASIDKIFIVDKENNSILVERQAGLWKLNGKYLARQSMTNHLLDAMLRMRVKEPVAHAAKENVIKALATQGKKVEIYQKGKLTKTFYVGGPTQDSKGTYMLIENSASPFVVEIPGFRGYISVRFNTHFNKWLSNILFKLPYNEVGEIKYENYEKPEESYKIVSNEEKLELSSPVTNKVYSQFDTIEVKKVIASLKLLAYSKVVEDVPPLWQDSIRQSKPMMKLTITERNGKSTEFKGFVKPGWGKVDAFGEPLKRDTDNFFLLLEDGLLTYGQYYSFDYLFTPLNELVNK